MWFRARYNPGRIRYHHSHARTLAGASRRNRVEPLRRPHRPHRHPPHRRRPFQRHRRRPLPCGPPFRTRPGLPAAACPRNLPSRRVRKRPHRPRPLRVGLRRLRGPHHPADPGRPPGLVSVDRRRAERRNRRPGGRPRRKSDRARISRSRRWAMSRSSPTDTSCAS